MADQLKAVKQIAEESHKRSTNTINSLQQELKELSQLLQQATLEKGTYEQKLVKAQQKLDHLPSVPT